MDENRWIGEREIPFGVWAAKREIQCTSRPRIFRRVARTARRTAQTCASARRAIRTLLDADGTRLGSR